MLDGKSSATSDTALTSPVSDRAIPKVGLKNLAQRDDFLVRGVMRRRFAAHSVAFFKPMDTVFVDRASRDLGKHHAAETRNQVAICTRVLPARIGRTPLSLRDDVEFAQ